ncbi:DUF4129 domain-containing protein [Roseimaritima ulvae]|uniref:Protein-glutamine gamma-glutamyltransferase-like C-terminal domain-containing protein n=1 Tax=Roseimaritima ulvae TaxID=980254 RepID=A0A5B9R321_9BACT|nr:DUF4129 domain-containing protein [Roseimaritima ulvae]QEG40691.1 hypothetical protein UC8_27080 [Roseimaritima ulvae]
MICFVTHFVATLARAWGRTSSPRSAASLLILLATALSAASQETSVPTAAEVESNIAESVGDTAWYDSETQQLRPVTVRERIDDASNRNSRWLPKPERVSRANPAAGGGGGGATGVGTSSASNIIGWVLMTFLAVLMIGVLVYFFSKGEMEVDIGAGKRRKTRHDPFDQDLTERMEQLPVEVRQQGSDMRGEAERRMRAGDFDTAIIYLFGHQLLQLDRYQMLRLSRGKTNRQYVREANASGESGRILQQTVDSFEASYFGRHAVTASRFEFLWKENERLEQLLRQHREAAA